MSASPVRRLTALVGLLALAPTAVLLQAGALRPVDAAVRAGCTLLIVLLLARLATWWLESVASQLEQRVDDHGDHGGR